VDSDRVDARFEQQEGGHELGAWCKDETVPRLLVRKDAWEAMQVWFRVWGVGFRERCVGGDAGMV
jgi:hypothetical protein